MDRVSFLPKDHAPPPLAPPTDAFPAAVAESLGQQAVTVTASGREAMHALFRHLGLRAEHEVYVTTTFGYPNVSACVTSTIFNYCKPSRVLSSATRALFVIHEFGMPHADTPWLRQEATRRGIPLIEDCAHGISSAAPEGWRVGELGDWTIISLPKLFPTAAGGLLVGPCIPYCPSAREEQEMASAASLAAAWWPTWGDQARQRRFVFRSLTGHSLRLGFSPLFEVSDVICPWFFPIHVRCPEAVQQIAQQRGVDCGLWHGSDIVVFPCHQFLGDEHIRKIAAVLAHVADRLPNQPVSAA